MMFSAVEYNYLLSTKVFVYFAADILLTKQSRREPLPSHGQHEKRRKLNFYAENCKHSI